MHNLTRPQRKSEAGREPEDGTGGDRKRARARAERAGERNDGRTGSCVSIAVLISSPVTRWSPRWSSAEAADGRRSGWCGVPTDERRRDDASVPLRCALTSEGGRREDDTDDTDPASDGGAGDLREVSAALATSESGVERAEPDDGGEKASSPRTLPGVHSARPRASSRRPRSGSPCESMSITSCIPHVVR